MGYAPLLMGHIACWADVLMAVAGLGSTPCLEGRFFSLISLVGHVLRFNSQTGTEPSSVCSINCDRQLNSGIRALECNECWLSDNRWFV